MTRKQRRLAFIGGALTVLMVAVGLSMFALRDNIVFFYSPTELQAKTLAPGTRVRIGGLVKNGTLVKSDGKQVRFVVTDTNKEIPVTYNGILPDLFREGQGVVAEGVMVNGALAADNVLAKHDEKYMPREVADALKKQGVWQETKDTAKAAERK
ncbi:MAG: cytochrome c maturation protein CcmE [Hyphomicrobiales bacterium]|nr:cytochrome c maturation protein CcmE [Hyphomicrobiales bacterium]